MDPSWLWAGVGQAIADAAPLFRFIHGLAFFVLGMAILFAISRARRLEIARRLPLLIGLAFCEAIIAWDSVLASAFSTPHVIPPLGQTVLLGLGYGALLTFGLLLPLPPGPHARARVGFPVVLLALWLVGILFSAMDNATSDQVALWGEVTARYGLALPGGLLSLWGFRRQSYRSTDARMLRLAKGSRRLAGGALGAFGILAGLTLPSTLLLSTEWATRVLLPIHALLLAMSGVTLTYGLTQTLNIIQREVERWIEGVEQTQALAADRERIGRELHDGIIQSIYAAGLMLEGARQMIAEDAAAAETQISRAMSSLNQTIQDIRRYIFDLRGEEFEADLVDGLEVILRDFRVNTLLDTELIIEGRMDTHPFGAERQQHIFQIVREALSNVARHARARSVVVRLSYDSDALQLQITDDGVGLAQMPTTRGRGLRNIWERAHLLEGTLDIDSAPGRGLTLTLTAPYLKGEPS